MNSQDDNTSTRDPLAPYGSLNLDIDLDGLRDLDMESMRRLQSAVHTVGDVICGLVCQPRFFSHEEHEYNAAGERLSRLLEFINVYEQAIMNVVTAAKPASSHDVKYRAWTMLNFNAAMNDDLVEVAGIAVEGLREIREAKVREARS